MTNCNFFCIKSRNSQKKKWNLGLSHTRNKKHVLNSWKDHTYILSLIVYRHIIFNPPDFAFFYLQIYLLLTQTLRGKSVFSFFLLIERQKYVELKARSKNVFVALTKADIFTVFLQVFFQHCFSSSSLYSNGFQDKK